MDPELVQLADGLWTASDELRLPGFRMPVRMTVTRLADGGLWVHSPVRATDALVAAVGALGPVTALVAPNCLHHLRIGAWHARFPAARVWGAPGLQRKRADLAAAGLASLGSPAPDLPAVWRATLDAIHIDGAPELNETVFLHRPSRTLLVTDLVFNIVNPPGWSAAFFLSLTGTRGRLAQSRLWRWRYARDRAATAASIERVLGWDFDRLVPAHGAVLDTGAKAGVARVTRALRGATSRASS